MRIGIITTMSGFPWGGSEFLWVETAKQALVEGNEVCISLFDWAVGQPQVVHLEKLGAKIFPQPRFEQPPKPSQYFRDFLAIDFDRLVISQGSTFDVLGSPELLKLFDNINIPYSVICQLNSDDIFLDDAQRLPAYQFLSKAKSAAFVSLANLLTAQRQLAKNLPNAIVVQNPVNLSDSGYIEFPRTLPLRFASVARLDARFKGQDILLEALGTEIWKNRKWSCHLYGTGPDKKYLEDLAFHYGLAGRIHFMGHVNDIREIWAENHVLVLPSRAEGTPLALVEAMLCGRPAIVTDVGGNTTWIEEGKTGFIAESPKAKYFGRALEKAWQARLDWDRMGHTAHHVAKNKVDASPGKTLLNAII